MKLDPRTKLVVVVCFSTLAIVYDTPGRLFLLLAGSVAILLMFRVNPGRIWGRLRYLLPLFVILTLVQSILSPGGKLLAALGPAPLVTDRGLTLGAVVVLRIAVVLVISSLLTTVNSRDIILGLVQWKVPYELAFMTSVAIRFLPDFREEMQNVVTAVQLRGVELKKVSWDQKLELYRRLFFPVVYGAVHRAGQLAVAMEARGLRAYPQRTYLRLLKLSLSDYTLMLSFLTATIILSFI